MKKTLIILALIIIAISSNGQEKFAVLIIGDYANRGNDIPIGNRWNGTLGPPNEVYDEFWNDTFLMWEMLQSKGFDPDKIFVLFADGNDCHPTNPRYRTSCNVSNYAATVQNVQTLFSNLLNGTEDIPAITEDDFLFVWIFDHGGGTNGNSSFQLLNNGNMSDTEFAALVNPIPAHKKVFWMQQCNGGGFADNLSSENTVFISASQSDQNAFRADNMTQTWYTCVENENYPNNSQEVYHHGEFNFHMISVVRQESPTHLTYYYDNDYEQKPYSEGDLNSDNVISMNEAYLWDSIHDSRTTWSFFYSSDESEDPLYDDPGSIGSYTSFDYPTLLFDNIGNNETHRGIIGVSKDLVVADGQILTFTGKSDVTLCGSSKIVIYPGATLIIDGEVSFHGTNDNLFEIQGALVQNAGSSLSFCNMQVVVKTAEFSISDAFFIETGLRYCPSMSSAIAGSSSLIGSIDVNRCQFNNPSKSYAIKVENCRDFNIQGNTVVASGDNGIYIMNSGNVPFHNALRRKVCNNDIHNCLGTGLIFYASTGNILLNKIYGNSVGVKLLNRSNVLNFNGICGAITETQTQYIHDNNSYEIYMTAACVPQIMQYNAIHKANAGTVPFIYYDNTIAFAEQERSNIDIVKNEWGNNFIPEIHLYSTTFLVGFDYEPFWSLGECFGFVTDDEMMLYMADSLCSSGDYETSALVYRQIVSEFPTTVSAETALKALLSLECFMAYDFVTLKQYYLNDSIISSTENLSSLALHLANRCDEILANYNKAIAWYEDVITNPKTTYADSLFATIDLGNLYLEMEQKGIKVKYDLEQYRPKSQEIFDEQTEFALSLLPLSNDSGKVHLSKPSYPFWTDTIAEQPEGYVVDSEGNVEISTGAGMAWLISTVNGMNGCEPDDFDGRTVRLVSDIDFKEGLTTTYRFSPIGTRETPFKGTFDGGGHRLENLRMSYEYSDTTFFDIGIFGYICHATVKNILVGSSCYISASSEIPDYYRGGLVGFSDSLSLIENCYMYVHLVSFRYGGGMVGMNRNSTVRNCALVEHFGASIEGAGLVYRNCSEGGYADAVVENCYFHGWLSVSYSGQYLAGLVCFNEAIPNGGSKHAIVRNSHSTPTQDFVAPLGYGTLVATNSEGSLINNCYTDLTKMAQYQQMVGVNEGELRDCSSYTSIDGEATLAIPVTINGTTTENLLDALNLWIVNQDNPELYRTWTISDSGIPVFGDYHTDLLENNATIEAIVVYPNPTTDRVFIEGIIAGEVRVYDSFGQLVKTFNGPNEIDLKGLLQGIYMLSITNEKGVTTTRKVVVR